MFLFMLFVETVKAVCVSEIARRDEGWRRWVVGCVAGWGCHLAASYARLFWRECLDPSYVPHALKNASCWRGWDRGVNIWRPFVIPTILNIPNWKPTLNVLLSVAPPQPSTQRVTRGASQETCESATFMSVVILIRSICQGKLVEMLRGSYTVALFLDRISWYQAQVEQLHTINCYP